MSYAFRKRVIDRDEGSMLLYLCQVTGIRVIEIAFTDKAIVHRSSRVAFSKQTPDGIRCLPTRFRFKTIFEFLLQPF